jgi:hypothetical protein
LFLETTSSQPYNAIARPSKPLKARGRPSAPPLYFREKLKECLPAVVTTDWSNHVELEQGDEVGHFRILGRGGEGPFQDLVN